jgi:hypothetical protein
MRVRANLGVTLAERSAARVMIVRMRSEQRPGRRFLFSVWVLLSVAPTVIAGAALVGSVSESRYDSHENRAPEARIAVAAIATVVGLAAVSVAVQRLRGRQGRVGLFGGLVLIAATVLLIALWGIVTLASGPL